MKKQTTKEFLDKIWSINPSYKERFCYELCIYTGMKNNIKIIVFCSLFLSGCAVPVPVQIASWALDGISLLATYFCSL